KGGDGPYGSANVVLTPGRSLAVDRKHLPLHAPIWLSASHPDPKGAGVSDVPFNRLLVAQDTGGAISGEIRGDVFWGFGDDAEEIAGRMANKGRYWLLLPNKLAEKLMEQS
ncbi:MAG: 3D domain-containing protein, partial [Cellvibrionaceae bacterium]|nr:3D domain-containing protein [Cellvibrionaceae bacterium]